MKLFLKENFHFLLSTSNAFMITSFLNIKHGSRKKEEKKFKIKTQVSFYATQVVELRN